MKTLHPQHAEPAPELEPGSSRRRSQRRRYLYEIEFFDAGHTGRLRPAPRTPQANELAIQDDELGLAGPRDPRLREIISAAATGWVIGNL
jgi:hypothetical protein